MSGTQTPDGPRVSVVIPSFSSERAASLENLERALAEQTFTDHEVIVVRGVAPQGRAINLGAARTSGEILVIFDDDSAIRDPELLAKLVATLDADPGIGMAGASVQTPDDAPWLLRRAARELPRFNVPLVTEVTDSDLVCHGGVALPRAAFLEVGGEREQIVRGLDPDLRQRLRDHGYRVVLVPDAAVYHPLPTPLSAFVQTFVRNGRGSARSQVQHPELVFETAEAVSSDRFIPRRSLTYRALRFPLRILWASITLRPLRALAYAAYGFGYLTEIARLRREARGS